MKLDLIDEIEQWAADKFEQNWEEERASAAFDRWMDRQSERGWP